MTARTGVITGRQPTRILAMLGAAYEGERGTDGWVCSNEFVAEYMPRFSSVIHSLRHNYGLNIKGTRCTMHEHRGPDGTPSGVFMFRLEAKPYRVLAHGPGITSAQVHEGEQLTFEERRT